MTNQQLMRDMGRYIQYLENQREHIGNRDSMPSKKWWESHTEEERCAFLVAIANYRDSIEELPAEAWGKLYK